ncbi:MAG TPA: DUF4339 domain-containing protein [Tepidisphaeraceae bacterium]|jgi:hypothetical protein|nr:DUF4339 domain-containing protein [Tepidisphaeraceae bacterium]
MTEWFVRIKGLPKGPLSMQQMLTLLNYGSAKLTDEAWCAGMAKWVPIETIQDIIDARTAALAVPLANIVAPAADDGPFHRVGSSMYLFKMQWDAVAIASPKAFYLAKVNKVLPRRMPRLSLLIMDGILENDAAHDVHTAAMSKLPAPVQTFLRATGDVLECDVLVVPRNAVTFVGMAMMNSRVSLRLGGEEIVLGNNPLGNTRKFLESNGWKLDQELFPAESLILRRPRYFSLMFRLFLLAALLGLILAAAAICDRMNIRI